tara:strand:- start:714 stop:1247 length:534 start_codon:yes stop_codon:yes gene_type:complete
MIERLKIVYKENIRYLNALIAHSLESVVQEQYYFEGQLDTESMGALKLKLSDGQEFTFDCNGDAESLHIHKSGFKDRGTLETDFEDNRYRWKEREFLSAKNLNRLGKITNAYLEILTHKSGEIRCGCKIEFMSGDYLYVWTMPSDNIFYGLNAIPPYYAYDDLKIELKEIKTLYNNT